MSVLDRLKTAFSGLAQSAVPRIDYYAHYSARVVSQSSDKLKVDVQPDDPRLPGMSGIEFRTGVAGAVAQIQPNAYVLISWDGGNPSKPYAHTLKGESVIQLNLTADTIVLNNGTAHVIRVGDATLGHAHSYTLNAGPYPVAGTIGNVATGNTDKDTMAENNGTVKSG